MIIEYDKRYKDDFIKLNEAWIKEFFEIEKEDEYLFNHVDDLINDGANIYFNIEDGEVIACAMIEPFKGDTWEISKVAAKNFGSKKRASYPLIEKCINYAKSKNAKRINIITNSMLKNAIHIYKKFGFVEYEDESLKKIFKRGDYFLKLDL